MGVLQLVVSKDDFMKIDKMRLEYSLKNDLKGIISRSKFLYILLEPSLNEEEENIKWD